MTNNMFTELKKFREDRNLDTHTFDIQVYLTKDLEEMLELLGYPDSYCKAQAKNMAIQLLEDRDAYQDKKVLVANDTKEVRVDALGDRIVYAVEAIEQEGFDAEIVMNEVAKEINSREGEVINGKFEKFRTQEAVAKWYKADFSKARR